MIQDERLSTFMRDNIQSCPPEGSGVHRWICHSACALVRHFGTEIEDSDLALAISDCSVRKDSREIADAVAYARREDGECESIGKSILAVRRKPVKRSPGRIKQVIRDFDGFSLKKLESVSPDSDVGARDASYFLSQLFGPRTLICMAGYANAPGVVRPLEFWLDRSKWHTEFRRGRSFASPGRNGFLVPHPMRALHGLTKGPNPHASPRAASNVDSQSIRYQVLEFDQPLVQGPLQAQLDAQAKVIAHLASYAPLVLTLFSGGKSLHAWFDVGSFQHHDREDFFSYACRLGADPAVSTATHRVSQLVRLPAGTRYESDGSHIAQTVHFFRPPTLQS